MNKTMAGIVLFNPDLERLNENIDAIVTQVDHVLLVDNNSKNFKEIEASFRGREKISLLKNSDNLGIATALDEIMQYASQNCIDWVLTLDQDSVCQPGLIAEYKKYLDLPLVAMLTCRITDRNFKVDYGIQKALDVTEIEKCITAASFVNVSAYEASDGFDKKMFIDGVDFDICLNLRQHGFKIYRVNYDGLLQEVGNGRNVKLFGKPYIIYNHSPFRCYYIARNNIYLARKYVDVSMKHMIGKEILAEIATVLYEDQKMEKLKQRWRGFYDGIKMKV